MGNKTIGQANTDRAIAELGKEYTEVGVFKRERKRNQPFAPGDKLGHETAVRLTQAGAGRNEFEGCGHRNSAYTQRRLIC